MRDAWTVAVNDGDEVVRHYPFNETGFLAAATHAKMHNYEMWQSFDGKPRYLMQMPRR